MAGREALFHDIPSPRVATIHREIYLSRRQGVAGITAKRIRHAGVQFGMEGAMAHMTSWVHQYTLRELLDDSFDLFKEQATALMLAGAIPFALVVLYVTLMRIFVIPGNLLQEFTLEAAQEVALSTKFWHFILGSLACSGIAMFVSYIAQCRIATWHALGREVSLKQAFTLLAKPCLSLAFVIVPIYAIFNSIAGSVVSVVGGIIFVAVSAIGLLGGPVTATIMTIIGSAIWIVTCEMGLIFVTALFLALPVILAVEHAGPFTALSRSFRFAGTNMKAHGVVLYAWTRIPAIFMPVLAVLIALLIGVSGYISPTMNVLVVSVLVLGLGSAVFMGMLASFQALVYLDGRSRAEALDLVLLARDIGLSDELEGLAETNRPVVAAPTYPDYSSSPRRTNAASQPSFTAVNATQPAMPSGFPDYSAPPPKPVMPAPESMAAGDAEPTTDTTAAEVSDAG
ncbi:MAG: hypothetical protein ACYDBB_10870 [Armatimonadota bacterium]